MMKKVTGLSFLLVMLCCTLVFSVTYAKYVLSKNITGEVKTRSNCMDMGITSLKECMLVMDTTTNDVDSAKLYISSKKADFTKMAPVINYIERRSVVTNENGIVTTNRYFTYASSYTFDSSTGMFTLGSDYVLDELSDNYINYYTCGINGSGVATMCPRIYKVLEYKKTVGSNSVVTSKITKAEVIDYNSVDSFDSEIGLYAADDNYGTSYYYRGNVKNNYVSYAGFIWRIVRQNGDGSIRLIYSGDSTSSSGKDTTIGFARYNYVHADPTYVGYMYGKNFVKQESSGTAFNTITPTAVYYFASSYSFNESTGLFTLSGNTISGVWKDTYANAIANYPYTCFKTSATATCDYIVKLRYINGQWGSAAKAYANIISYTSKDYNSTLANTNDSDMKVVIDKWYVNNLLSTKDSNGKLYSSYLADNIFCNDRSFEIDATINKGNGYSLAPSTFYNTYKRATGYNPSLKCSQESDRFTVNSSNGNGKLTYAIGLLTSDEALYSGAQYRAINNQFYLYNTLDNATMSPHIYHDAVTTARIFYFGGNATNGSFYGAQIYNYFYIRPVVNLRSDIKITSGNGTAESPYIVSL